MRISTEYWDSIVCCGKDFAQSDLWRLPVNREYARLIARWGETHQLGYVLKTDLFEEATSAPAMVSCFEGKVTFLVGMDRSSECVAQARKKLGRRHSDSMLFVCCDVRHLPFKHDIFDLIVSNSTLDHFTAKKDIGKSLKEILRVSKTGAILFLTLDNPLNPLIFLRNMLPYRLLKTLRLIPYFMGSLLTKSELVRLLESIGYKVCCSSYILHFPRILSVAAERLWANAGDQPLWQHFIAVVNRFEILRKLPIRSLTGHFIMVGAAKEAHEWRRKGCTQDCACCDDLP